MAHPARILVVDDDVALRSALAQALEERGYEVACAGDGREALQQLGSRPPPSVILLDLVMPVMDGWSFRAAQRLDPRLAAIPTVVLSASLGAHPATSEPLEVEATLTKPFQLSRLIETLARFCPAV